MSSRRAAIAVVVACASAVLARGARAQENDEKRLAELAKALERGDTHDLHVSALGELRMLLRGRPDLNGVETTGPVCAAREHKDPRCRRLANEVYGVITSRVMPSFDGRADDIRRVERAASQREVVNRARRRVLGVEGRDVAALLERLREKHGDAAVEEVELREVVAAVEPTAGGGLLVNGEELDEAGALARLSALDAAARGVGLELTAGPARPGDGATLAALFAKAGLTPWPRLGEGPFLPPAPPLLVPFPVERWRRKASPDLDRLKKLRESEGPNTKAEREARVAAIESLAGRLRLNPAAEHQDLARALVAEACSLAGVAVPPEWLKETPVSELRLRVTLIALEKGKKPVVVVNDEVYEEGEAIRDGGRPTTIFVAGAEPGLVKFRRGSERFERRLAR